MRIYQAEILKKDGRKFFLEVEASSTSEALHKVASQLPQNSYKQISVPDLSDCQRFAEWLKKINSLFE